MLINASRLLISAVASVTLVASFTPAQVPAGWAATASFSTSLGTGGIAFIHPSSPGTFQLVTGLPPELITTGATLSGANSIAALADGSVVVSATQTSTLHRLTFSGNQVVNATQTSFSPSGSVAQLVPLSDGRVLFGAGAGSAGVVVGTLNPNGALTIFPTPGIPSTIPGSLGTLNAIAVDRAETTAYIGISGSPREIWSLPLSGGGGPNLILPALGFSIFNMDVEANGNLIVATGGSLRRVNPTTGAVTTLSTPGATAFNAIAVDRLTGDFVVGTGLQNRRFYRVSSTGAVTTLVTANTLGLGLPSGVSLRPAIEVVGAGTPGASSYDWLLDPNPGGAPVLGNAAFSLTLSASPACTTGLLFISALPAAAPIPVAGALLYVDPATLIGVPLPLPCTPTITVGFPLPATPSLAGVPAIVQAGFLEPGSVAASSALRVTLF